MTRPAASCAALCAVLLWACDRPAEPQELRPVGPGEQLTFQLSYLGAPVGLGTVALADRDGCWELTAQGEVNVSGVYRVKAASVDRLDATAQRTVTSVQSVEQDGRLRHQTVRVGEDGTVEVHRDQPAPPTDRTITGGRAPSAAVGALYGLRARPLAVGARRAVEVFDGSKTLTLEVEARRTLELDTLLGARRVTELIITGARTSGPLRVYLTDDAARLPVRLEAGFGAGVAVLEVTDVQTADSRPVPVDDAVHGDRSQVAPFMVRGSTE